MGTGESGTPVKTAKVLTQEQKTSTTPPPHPNTYPEWAAAFQAYYNSGGQPPPAYFPPSLVSGPQPHPYMWGGQPMMPPYGTPPPPYGAVYSPHGGMYAHPSMPPGAHAYSQYGMPSPSGPSESTMVTPAAAPAAEAEGMRASGVAVKDRSLSKMSRGSLGSLGMLTGKGGGKDNSGSGNGVFSQSSGESGSDGSSEGSEEEDNSQAMLRKKRFDQMASGGDGSGAAGSAPAAGQPLSGQQLAFSGNATDAVGGPTTNLGIGIQDYWSGSNPGAVGGGKGVKRSSGSTSGGMGKAAPSTPSLGAGGRDGVPPELWLQDEREVKRQRRKQSNRESARRSRLRKQAECEELGTRVDSLTMENLALRNELNRLSEDCKKLTADNTSLLEQLRKYQEEDSILVPEQGGDDKHDEALTMQPDGNGKVDDGCNRSSPMKQVIRRDEEERRNSPGKLTSTLDDGAHPGTIGAG